MKQAKARAGEFLEATAFMVVRADGVMGVMSVLDGVEHNPRAFALAKAKAMGAVILYDLGKVFVASVQGPLEKVK